MNSSKRRANRAKAAAGAAFFSGIAALAVPIPPVSAADYGVGVFHFGQGSTVVAPIRLESLTVEPEVNLFRASSNQETFHVVTVATGIYFRRALGPSFEGYAGGRIGYSRSKERFDTGSGIEEFTSHSWMLSPTLGAQYFFSRQFSIGLDVGLQYVRSSQKTDAPPPIASSSINGYTAGTLTRILLRAYF